MPRSRSRSRLCPLLFVVVVGAAAAVDAWRRRRMWVLDVAMSGFCGGEGVIDVDGVDRMDNNKLFVHVW